MFLGNVEFTDFFFLEKYRHFVRDQQFTTGFSRGYCWWDYWDWTLFWKTTPSHKYFYLRVTPSWWMYLYKSCLCHRNQQNIKSKILLEQFFFIDQDTYWAQPNGCLNSDMFYLDKLLLVEKGNIVLAKSICRSIEYSHRVITRNEFKMSCKLATAF